jgi:hypothetical protein
MMRASLSVSVAGGERKKIGRVSSVRTIRVSISRMNGYSGGLWAI